jgi:hypothetical protein
LSKIAHHNDGPPAVISTRVRAEQIIFYAIAVWRNGCTTYALGRHAALALMEGANMASISLRSL